MRRLIAAAVLSASTLSARAPAAPTTSQALPPEAVLPLAASATRPAGAPPGPGLSQTVPPITTNALMSAALDRVVSLDLNGRLPDVMEAITKQGGGVPITADPAVWELLPWGQDTTIGAKITNQTLRSALQLISRKLGLVFEVKAESVEFEPSPGLRRLARRSTVEELSALDKLASTPLAPAKTQMTVKELIDTVDAKLEAAKLPFGVENRTSDAVRPDQMVKVSKTDSLMDALEELLQYTSATWYPWGKSLVIADKQDQIRRQLARPLTVRYNGVDVGQVLLELQQRGGIHFEIEPGAIQQVPAESRNVRLVMENLPLQDALEAIGGYTGLGYIVRENGIYLWNQNQSRTGGSARPSPVFAILPTDTGFQVLVPESDVPADLREFLKARAQKELGRVRQMMNEERGKAEQAPAAANRPVAIPATQAIRSATGG